MTLVERLREDAASTVEQLAAAGIDAQTTETLAGQAAALIASQARRIAELEANCRPLVDACYDEMHGTVCDDEPDDEPVATTRDVAGNISHSAITFGMIRRARATLKGET